MIVTARTRPEEPNFAHQFVAADLTKPEHVTALAHKLHNDFGGVDILIDNIGGLTTPGGGFSTLTDEHWENEIQFNLLAAIRLDRALLPAMLKKRNGVIIHISTAASMFPLWDINMAYAVSKAALNCYSKNTG